MRGRSDKTAEAPTMMIHHVREIQLRLLSVVGILILGMIVGYMYYEPLFEFIKAPLNGPLHYTSPAGSFTFIIKICMMIGVITTLPVVVYNVIMFIQPALAKRLSRVRVYLTTLASLLLAGAGAAFAFLIIIPLALRFFYKFQVDGLVAIISADEYLRFVVGVIITFVLIFQLPLFISLIDHITPLQPKKLLKFEKYIIVGSVFIGVLVPFALDPTVQLLIASPIVILYNFSILIVMMQHGFRRSRTKKPTPAANKVIAGTESAVRPMSLSERPAATKPTPLAVPMAATPRKVVRSMDGVRRSASSTPTAAHTASSKTRTVRPRTMTDIRPAPRPASRLAPPPRTQTMIRRQIAE
jgi:sec-independent protein translocase protein TatC